MFQAASAALGNHSSLLSALAGNGPQTALRRSSASSAIRRRATGHSSPRRLPLATGWTSFTSCRDLCEAETMKGAQKPKKLAKKAPQKTLKEQRAAKAAKKAGRA